MPGIADSEIGSLAARGAEVGDVDEVLEGDSMEVEVVEDRKRRGQIRPSGGTGG